MRAFGPRTDKIVCATYVCPSAASKRETKDMCEWIAWIAALGYLLSQVPPLLGALFFRAYIVWESIEASQDLQSALTDPDSRDFETVTDDDATDYEKIADADGSDQKRKADDAGRMKESARLLALGLTSLRRAKWFYISPSLGHMTKLARKVLFRITSRRPRRAYRPKATVILPCRGLDPGFEKNVQSMLNQVYPDFEMIFVTFEEDDPAYEVLRRIRDEHPGAKIKLVTTQGKAALLADKDPAFRDEAMRSRGQKLSNQLAALTEVRDDSEVLVFLDSDIRAHPHFLMSLIEPLGLPEGGGKGRCPIGATTGFRWYVPEKGGFGSYLRATWNGGGVPVQANAYYAYTWGGAMAVKKAVFNATRIRKRWETALTDDFPVTDEVQKMGHTVHFVPSCLVPSHEDSSLRATIEWTNRQTIICRVYNPKLWSLIARCYVWPAFLFLAALGIAAFGCTGRLDIGLGFLGLLGIGFFLQALLAFVLWPVVTTTLLKDEHARGTPRLLKHLACMPFAIALITFNSFYSLFCKTITWRGIRYKLISSEKTEVLSGG